MVDKFELKDCEDKEETINKFLKNIPRFTTNDNKE